MAVRRGGPTISYLVPSGLTMYHDFSACSAAQAGDLGKLQRAIQRDPGAVHNDGANGELVCDLGYEPHKS